MMCLNRLIQSTVAEHLGHYHFLKFQIIHNILITISLDSSLIVLLGFVSGSQLAESLVCGV